MPEEPEMSTSTQSPSAITNDDDSPPPDYVLWPYTTTSRRQWRFVVVPILSLGWAAVLWTARDEFGAAWHAVLLWFLFVVLAIAIVEMDAWWGRRWRLAAWRSPIRLQGTIVETKEWWTRNGLSQNWVVVYDSNGRHGRAVVRLPEHVFRSKRVGDAVRLRISPTAPQFVVVDLENAGPRAGD